MWQWFHFLQGQVPPGRPVLRLNLDENSIKFWYEVFAKIVRELGKVLRARAGGRQAILLLDAHVCHYMKSTMGACGKGLIAQCVINNWSLITQ